MAFYCRVNHRDRDYEKYLDDVMRRLEEEYGKQKWDLQIFFEEASGADQNRKEFNCSKKNVDVVCIDKVEDAQAIFRRIQEFQKRFFEGSDVMCE